jgi:hypothetical protein
MKLKKMPNFKRRDYIVCIQKMVCIIIALFAVVKVPARDPGASIPVTVKRHSGGNLEIHHQGTEMYKKYKNEGCFFAIRNDELHQAQYDTTRFKKGSYTIPVVLTDGLSISDSISINGNGCFEDDGSCSGRMVFEVQKLVDNNWEKYIPYIFGFQNTCGMGYKIFDNKTITLPSLLQIPSYLGVRDTIFTAGSYRLSFRNFHSKEIYHSAAIQITSYLTTDKTIYTENDSMTISFKTPSNYGIEFVHCSKSFNIMIEEFDPINQKWVYVNNLNNRNCDAQVKWVSSVSDEGVIHTITRAYFKKNKKYRLCANLLDKPLLGIIRSTNHVNPPKNLYSNEFYIK